MQDVAADHDLQSGEIVRRLAPVAQRMAQRQRIEQRLGRMLVLPVARIEHGAADLVGDQLGCPARTVADDDRVGAHRVEGDRGIDQRLALFHRRLGGMHVDDIRPQPLARDLEAQQRARGILEEGVDHRQPGQPVLALGCLPVERNPLLRLVEQEQDLVPFELADPDQVAMRESEPARGIAGGVRRGFRRCH